MTRFVDRLGREYSVTTAQELLDRESEPIFWWFMHRARASRVLEGPNAGLIAVPTGWGLHEIACRPTDYVLLSRSWDEGEPPRGSCDYRCVVHAAEELEALRSRR